MMMYNMLYAIIMLCKYAIRKNRLKELSNNYTFDVIPINIFMLINLNTSLSLTFSEDFLGYCRRQDQESVGLNNIYKTRVKKFIHIKM
jgi:hypothetical protein